MAVSLISSNIYGFAFIELWTFRSQDHSLPGAKVPGVELSLPGTFAPWNFCTLELKSGAQNPFVCNHK